MLTIEQIKKQLIDLNFDLNGEKNKNKKVKLEKEIKTLTNQLDNLSAYENINIGDRVINGNPERIGVVTLKEIQNTLPMVWVDWGATTMSSVAKTLTVIDPKQLDWHWLGGKYTRDYDRRICDDLKVLLDELIRLRNEIKVLSSSSACLHSTSRLDMLSSRKHPSTSSNPQQEIIELQDKIEIIIQLWEDAIGFQFPLDAKFSLDGKPVKIESYGVWEEHDLCYPIVVGDGTRRLVPPFKLERITISQLEAINKTHPDLIIDEEFKNLLRPLTEDEFNQLEKNLLRDRTPIVTVWKGRNTIIDGHHNYAIARKHNIPYTIREVELETRYDVIQWMYDLQKGRRNLTEDEKSYYRAKQYESIKEQKQSGHSDRPENQPKNIAVDLAKKEKVGERTIRRDATYGKNVEWVAEQINEPPQKIIQSPLTRKQVGEIAKAKLSPEIIRKKLDNPYYVDKTEYPTLKVGDVVKIKSDRKNKDFVGYNGTIAIVEQVYEFSADIRIWQKLLPQVHFQFLQLIEGDLVTFKVTITQGLLRNLMITFDRFEDSITPF